MKSTHLAALALALAGAALGACSAEAPAADPAAGANQTGITVSNARLVLPAVSGNPGAVYFDARNGGDKNLAIRKVAVKGAGTTQMHGTAMSGGQMTMAEMGPVMIPAGETQNFAAGGRHVMVYDLDPGLVAGGTTEMTLTIAGGKTMTADLPIVAAGDDR